MSTRRHAMLIRLVMLAALVASCGAKTPSPSSSVTQTATPSPAAALGAGASAAAPAGKPAPWYRVIGGDKLDQGWGVDVDPAGNLYLVAYQQADTEPFTDIVVYKLAPDGSELWKTRWGGRWEDKGFVVTVSGSRVYVGGATYASAGLTDADLVVLALDAADGSLAWDFTWGQGFGYEEADGLVVDPTGIYVSGWTTGKTTGNDVAILKLDAGGGLVWARSWGGDHWDEADGQMVVDDTSIFVAGRYGATNILLGGQGLLARFAKATGDHVSHVTWGGPLGTDALGLTSDGTSLFTVGETIDRGNGSQIQVRRCDKALALAWERLWGGNGREDARSAVVTPGGDVLIAGASGGAAGAASAGGMDAVLLRYSAAGDLAWARTWGGPKDEAVQGLAVAGSVAYLTGNTRSFGNSDADDILLVAADAATGEFPDLAAKR